MLMIFLFMFSYNFFNSVTNIFSETHILFHIWALKKLLFLLLPETYYCIGSNGPISYITIYFTTPGLNAI